jgi:CxxC motif-containing protein (DUF1111 family)
MTQTRRCTFAITALSFVAAAAISSIAPPLAGQEANTARDNDRRTRFTHNNNLLPESMSTRPGTATEAMAAFDNQTNGFTDQPTFDANRSAFEEVEGIADGLGPIYNAQSCRECHQNILTGGASQVTVQRAGHLMDGNFFDSQGGSLIHSRAIHPDATELVAPGENIRTFRISPTTLGDGYIEAIANHTLTELRDSQPASVRGTAVIVPVLEASGQARIGRFGWKSQHASLQSFAADAYLNEMGITTPLLPLENTAGGRDVTPWDKVGDPEDDGDDVEHFADFMRATKASPRGAITSDVRAGEQVFATVGCGVCHVASIITAPAGTPINGGLLTVPAALGNKVILPYSDFLLHDVGTGDGIPIQPTAEYAETANKIRTAPLWGLRSRNRLMHDGLSLTREEAILRHAGQATPTTSKYQALSAQQKAQLLAFLNSL